MMGEARARDLLVAILIALVNMVLNTLMSYASNIMELFIATNLSMIVVFVAGLLVGLLGNVLILFIEFLAILLIHFVKLGISLNALNTTYISVPFIIGASLTSSLFRKLRVPSLDIKLDLSKFSDFLLISGSSLIATYVITLIPNSRGLLLSELGQLAADSYIAFIGLLINSMLISSYLAVAETKMIVLKYVISTLIAMFSWITMPLALTAGQLSLSVEEDYIVLGRIIRKLGSKGRPIPSFTGFIKVPLTSLVNKHMVIVGMSGSGKSYLAKNIVKQLSRRASVLVIDPHGEYVDLVKGLGGRVLTPYDNPINPLELLGRPKNTRAEEVSDMIRRVFKLGNLQKYALYNLILDTYEKSGDLIPTFKDVYEVLTRSLEVGSGIKEDYFSKDILYSLLPYIDLLKGPYLTSTTLKVDELFNGISVVDLSVTDSEFLRSIYVETILHMVDAYVRRFGRQLFIVVDEAHRFLGGRTAPLLSKLVMEGRKFGLNLIIVTQQPLDIDPGVIANSAYIVAFVIQEVNNLNYISKILGSSLINYEVVKKQLANLGKYEAMVKIRGDRNLYVIKT